MNPKSGNLNLSTKLTLLAASLALWVALVLLFATGLALTSTISWRQGIRFGISLWALWLIFIPVVAWLSFRFPIHRAKLIQNLTLHLVACLAIVAADQAAYRAIDRFSHSLFRFEAPGQVGLTPRPGPPTLGGFRGLRVALDILVFWSLTGFCHAIINFRRSQEREQRAVELEASLTSARLEALRMQINPHFLFNTLNSISALIYTNPRAADEMLGDLSALLRRSLDSMQDQEIPLRQELDFVRTYLSIEQKRFGERLRVEEHLPDDLLNALVPALILQPLVENAVRHGIEPQREPACIWIEAIREGEQLRLVVRDNGRGITKAETNNSTRLGIGLSNTKARLEALYGPNQHLSLAEAEPKGCRVDIYLPLHFQQFQKLATSGVERI